MISKILQEIAKIQQLQHDAQKPISDKITSNEKALLKSNENRYKNEVEVGTRIPALKKIVQEEAGDEAVQYLEAILENLSLHEMSLETRAKAKTYEKYFDESVYRQLLPYTQLAYAYEKNGSAENHALMLTILFKNTHSALDYLLKNTKNTTLHNACLFTLPDPEHCSFSIWQDLAKRNVDETLFRKILGQACEIEDLIKADLAIARQEKKKPDMPGFNVLKKTIEKEQAEWKKLHGNAEERDEKIECSPVACNREYNLLLFRQILVASNQATPK